MKQSIFSFASLIRVVKGLVIVIMAISICGFLYFIWFFEYYHVPPISFVNVESERTKLINGIESYQSIEEFKSFLNRSSFQWEDKAGQPSPKSRPPFNMYTITINNYSHLGFTGELHIGFLNDRLTGTTFNPSNIEKYIEALGKSEGIKFDKNGEAAISPYTRVRFATDYKGLKYIDWSDIRLDKEIDLWIKRYS